MAEDSYFYIKSNDGTALLAYLTGAGCTVTETGVKTSTDIYTYSGDKQFLGVAKTANATTPDYTPGATFYDETVYIVEAVSGIRAQINRISGAVSDQASLIEQIEDALEGKAAGSGGGVELNTCTVTNTSPTAGLYVACYDGETITAREIINTTRTDVIYPSFAHIIATRSNITVNSGNAEAIKETEYYDVLKIMGDCSVSIAFQEKT